MSFSTITLFAVSQRVFIIYFVIDSVRKLMDTLICRTAWRVLRSWREETAVRRRSSCECIE
jgi:hypothetical protein